jgi:hypothetical protein
MAPQTLKKSVTWRIFSLQLQTANGSFKLENPGANQFESGPVSGLVFT